MSQVILDARTMALMRAYTKPMIEKLQDDFENPSDALNAVGFIAVNLILDSKVKEGSSRADIVKKWASSILTSVEQNEARMAADKAGEQ